jgi:hypothetical protein
VSLVIALEDTKDLSRVGLIRLHQNNYPNRDLSISEGENKNRVKCLQLRREMTVIDDYRLVF